MSLRDLARWSGASIDDMRRFAKMYAKAGATVFVWSMGMTQHACGTDNVLALINVALARGNVGRPGAGLMPVRGHSGVQGGAEMGCYATAFPGGAPVDEAGATALGEQWGFRVPSTPGLDASAMVR